MDAGPVSRVDFSEDVAEVRRRALFRPDDSAQAPGHVVAGVFPPLRLLSDELWALFEPLVPAQPPAVHGRTGRPRVCDRDVLEGIAFVLSTGMGWAKLPIERGYGSVGTCWRRRREWAEAGAFDRVHQTVLDRLGQQGGLDRPRASLDSVSVEARRGVS